MKPRATRWLAAVLIVATPLYTFSVAAFPPRQMDDSVTLWVLAVLLSVLGVGIGIASFRRAHHEPPRSQLPGHLTDATAAVLAERSRQIHVEGYTRQHDADLSDSAVLAQAAAFYAMADVGHEQGHVRWPWDEDACKVKDRYDNYVRAAALLIAAADLELARSGRAEGRRA